MKYIPLHKVFMADSVKEAAVETLFSGYIGEGQRVEAFEEELSAFLGHPYLATVNSCTSGLDLAIKSLSRNERDEILTTPLTCLATNTPILTNCYHVKWVDVDPRTGNMDLEDLRRKLGPKSRAVMLVHWGGYPVDLDQVKKITQEYWCNWRCELPVIEDCAHAFGAAYKGGMVGASYNRCVFSFGPIKTLTCGDGGLITVGSHEAAKALRLKRWYGIDRHNRELGVQDPGFKYHMNDLDATIGRENLKHVAANVSVQQRNARLLREGLADVPGLTLMTEEPGYDSSYWLFTVLVERRADFIKKLADAGVQSNVVHRRNDRHPCMFEYRTYLPGMDIMEARMTCLPCGWWVTEEDVSFIIEQIKGGW